MATWSEESKLRLFIGDSSDLHSIKRDFGRGYVIVPARALDDVFEELKVEKVNCMKIDVEKSEIEVIKGLVKTLEKHRPTIIVEIWKDPTEVGGIRHEEKYIMQKIAPAYYILKPLESELR